MQNSVACEGICPDIQDSVPESRVANPESRITTPMPLLPRLMYGALIWKERQRARRESGSLPEGKSGERAVHLITGERGETLAYWYLRRAGYIIVARNRRGRSGSGELDLVGWDGPVLAFVEVKTRTTLEGGPPEAAVSRAQQKRIAKAAREYVRKLRRGRVNYRFDIASIVWDAESGYRVRLIKDAFKG